MRNVFDKDILRTVRHSLGRFLAIAAIVALGTGFYAGLRMIGPDMRADADRYYDQTALMDVRVVSTLGLTREDVEALSQVEGVQSAFGAYETDVLARIGQDQYAVRVHSLPQPVDEGASDGEAAIDGRASNGEGATKEAASDAEAVAEEGASGEDGLYGQINKLTLVEGRWPQAADECVLSADRVMATKLSLGDVVTVEGGVGDADEALGVRTFTVVGTVHSPYYVSNTAMGTTSLGSGVVEQFLYVPDAAFDPGLPYTEAFVVVAGAKDVPADSGVYQEKVDAVVQRIEALAPEREQARLEGLKADAQTKLDDARGELEDQRAQAQEELDRAERRLADAQRQIDERQHELDQAQERLEMGRQELADQRAQAQRRLDQAQAQVDEGLEQARQSQDQLPGLRQRRQEAQAQRDRLTEGLAQVNQGLAAVKAALDAPGLSEQEEAAYAAQEQQLEGQRAQLEAGIKQADDGIAQLDEGIAAIEEAPATAERAQQQLFAERQSAEVQLTNTQRTLDDSERQLQEGRAQLEQAQADVVAGRAEYEASKSAALAKLAQAQADLDAAQAEVDDLGLPEWLVMDRTKNPGVVSHGDDAGRIDSIAAVFPLFFFLVAALVALTTMTRMVEEERALIGTFKSLGYSKARIIGRYLAYSAVASTTGSVVGILALSQVLPAVVIQAYSIVYQVPAGPMPVDVPIAASALGLGVGITLLATWGAVYATLRETPAQLLLPRVPKAGKRILLERVKPVWGRFSFSWKVTFRNLFLYKKRLFMTVVGIAGCTALLLTGLGVQNAVNDIIDKQFGQIVHYEAMVELADDANEADREAVRQVLEGDTVAFCASAQTSALIAQGPDGLDISTTVVVPEDPEAFSQLWTMRTREGAEPVALSDDGAVLTEKLATRLGVSVGDEVVFAEQDAMGNATATTHKAKVAGIIENYLRDYAFFTPSAYERAFGEAPEYATRYVELAGAAADPTSNPSDEGHALREAFTQDLRAIDGVKTVAFNDETIDTYRTMLGSVNMVVVVLVAAAAVLAFVVLYNLTNINITERVREIATLKVLGFNRGEVSRYVFRETLILSTMGALVGLAFGVVLEGFVAASAEVDQVMFGRVIHPESFVIAFALTLAFTALVMAMMRKKLDAVDMVESLKSNE